MDSDENTQEISSSSYLSESQTEQEDDDTPLSNESYLVHCELNSTLGAVRHSGSISNYTTDSEKASSSNFQPQRPTYVTSSQEKLKKRNTKSATGYRNNFHSPNKIHAISHNSNLNREYSKARKKEKQQHMMDDFSSRVGSTVWQNTISHEKAYVQLNQSHCENGAICHEDLLVASSGNRKINNSINISDSVIDTRSPMLSDYTSQNSSLLIENCLVSSSTGHLDTISIPSIANIGGESDNFLYHSNLLDSNVDSTSEQLINSCPGDSIENEFNSNGGNITAAKFSTYGQNEKYFMLDHILNDTPRITQDNISKLDKPDLIGIPGPSGIARCNKNTSKFVKLDEKSLQDKNVLYCIQNFHYEVENSNPSTTDLLAMRDSISSVEFNSQSSECEQQSTALNLNRLSSEFYLDKKLSQVQEANIFDEESFSSVDYTDSRMEVRDISKESLVSNQQFMRDDFIIRAVEPPNFEHSHLEMNQQEQHFTGNSQCFPVENIEMNSAQDMTICKRIIPHGLQAASTEPNVCEPISLEEEKNTSDSNFIPEDLSSPLKCKNKSFRKSIKEVISKNVSPQTDQQLESSSYNQFCPPMSDIKAEINENIVKPGIWCDECDQFLPMKCSIHMIRSIIDKPVHSRPFASIPAQYLRIKVINSESGINGIFTRKTIARRVKFGPVEGPFLEGEPLSPKGFFVTRNAVRGYLDTSNNSTSNWMKFVRWAESFTEMNCVAVEEDNSIYFLTTVDIPSKTELKIGYSKHYSMKYGLQYLKPSEEELAALEPVIKYWSCFICGEKFKSSVLLEDHLTLHDTDDPKKKKRRRAKYSLNHNKKRSKVVHPEGNIDRSRKSRLHECEVCLLCFPMSDLLLLHKELHAPTDKWNRIDYKEKQENNSCPTCYQMFETRNDLSHHVNNHSINKNDSTIKTHKCNLCYKSFETEDKLMNHALVHLAKTGGDFPCQLCHRKFTSAQTLTSHQKFHKDNSEYVCPMCNKKFESLGLMKLHIPEHCINGVFTCPYCQKTFPIYHKIRRHIRTYHPETVHPCPQCGKTLSSMDKLKLHMLCHSDRRDFICDVCNRGFKRKDKLKEHQKRGHANISGKVSIKSEKVMSKDLENFKYTCDQCARVFKRRGMLVNHFSKQHPDVALDTVPELVQPILKECRIFFCHYCNKSYETSSKRKVHILKHHPGAALAPADAQCPNGGVSKVCNTVVLSPKKAFAVACPYCPRQYATNAKLLQHQRKHHKQDKSRKSKATTKEVLPTTERQHSEVLVTGSLQEEPLDNSQLIRLTPLTPAAVQVQLEDATRYAADNGEEVYVNVPTSSQPVVLDGNFSDEQTLTVLASNSNDSFCVALRPGQILSNFGVICQSELPYVVEERPPASASKTEGTFSTEDTFQEEHINFSTDTTKAECILTQVDSNSPVILWQPGLFSNVN